MPGIARSLRSFPLRLLPLSGLAVALAAGPAMAQEGGGGVLLTFGIEQRFSREDNPDLSIPSTGSRFRSDTRLSFGMLSETPRDRLAFSLATVLRGEDEGGGFDFGLKNPSAELAYTRAGAASSFTISAFLREVDLGEGVSLAAGEDDLPVLVFEEGTARSKGVRLGYSWGEGAPFGGALRAGLTDTAYHDTTDPGLVDNRTTTLGGGLRFALNPVTEATLDLDHRHYDEEGPAAAEDSTTLSAGLVRALPRGSLRGRISGTRDEGGTRTGLSFGRSFEMPRGLFSIDLGLTRAGGGDTDMTGALAWRQDLARGTFTARLSRAVSYDEKNDETLVTALSLGLTHELGPRTGLNLGASWARSEETTTGLMTDSSSISASVSYALTPDWAMSFGANHRLKDEDGTGRADASSVFLSIGRTFEWRP